MTTSHNTGSHGTGTGMTREQIRATQTAAGADPEVLDDPTHEAPLGHGNSPAAWTMVLMIIIGSVVVAFGMLAESWVTAIIGTVVIVAGLVAGFVLRMAGKGVESTTLRP